MPKRARINLGNFGLGLPSLLGVVLGVRLYTAGLYWCAVAVGVLVVLWAIMAGGRALVANRRPCLGAWIIEAWIASAVIVTALITDLVVSLTVSNWFPALLGNPTGQTLEKLSATLVGALTAFTALVWTKDIADAKGYFWPSTQFKAGLNKLYRQLGTNKPLGNTQPYDAMFEDAVKDSDIDGWSFFDRRDRAKIVADYLKRSH